MVFVKAFLIFSTKWAKSSTKLAFFDEKGYLVGVIPLIGRNLSRIGCMKLP